MANELRLPIIRIIEGSGGGGSVKTIETTGRANLPGGLGISQFGYQYLADNLGTVPVVALGLGSVAGLGAARLAASHYSVMTKIDLGDVRRRAAGGRAHRPEARQAGARRLGDPVPGRRRRPCGRHRGGGVRSARAASCPTCRPRSTASPPRGERDDPADRREETLFSVDPARPPQGLQDAADHRGGGRQGLLLRDGPACSAGPIITGLARLDGLPVAVLASDPFHYGGAWTADACAEGRALRRPGRDVPPAGRLPRATAPAS